MKAKKAITLPIGMTGKQFLAIKKAAEKAGVPVADYLKRICARDLVKGPTFSD
jgi:hypothetical protein